MLDKKKVGRFILFRTVTISVFLVSAIFLDFNDSVVSLSGLMRLTGATYLFSLLSLVILRFTRKHIRTVTYAQIVWDLILVTFLILLTGGVSSPYAFLYFLSIISASVLLARSEAYYTASLCVILNGAILDLQFYGRLAPLGLSAVPAQQYGASYLFYLIFLYSSAFYLTAYLAGHLSERARLSETALKEKAIDLEELERLNSSIVSTIDSGLVTVNGEGRIRVFNRCAELLTGVSQLEAYDRPLSEVLPGLAPFGRDLFRVTQGEFEHLGGDRRLVLSYKSVPLRGKEGEGDGAIIDLHDLTEIKRLEVELKRADRLAAVGELSARIAHEIRNPLAAISGSVQLVALRDWVEEKDKRLFSIILRETDRLEGLLREFLAYARPSSPNKVPLGLRQVVAELCALLGKDPRFDRVSVVNEVPEGVVLTADRDQLKQVFWNLLMNGAEAMEESGRIVVRAGVGRGAGGQDRVEITVADNGGGMTQEEARRVFEPFFTTKQGGTGLGLATVYRIVEAHGGRISMESTPGAGTTVSIVLPA